MRQKTVFALLLAAPFVLAIPAASPSAAVEQKWCAQYGRDGGRNCGFATFAQCMQTVSGIGGFCYQNTFYTGPAKEPAAPRKKHGN